MALSAFALPAKSFAAGNNRTSHPFGLYLSLLGDPFPSVWGINAAYNLAPWARLAAGYGSVSGTSINASLQTVTINMTTIGAGLKFMLPEANFTPVLGVNWAQVTVSTSGGSLSSTFNGFTASGSHIYATAGLDWTSSGGFNLGAGYNFSFTNGVGGAPFISLGWFF